MASTCGKLGFRLNCARGVIDGNATASGLVSVLIPRRLSHMALSASTFSCVFSVAAGICMHPSRLTYCVYFSTPVRHRTSMSWLKNAISFHSVGYCEVLPVVQADDLLGLDNFSRAGGLCGLAEKSSLMISSLALRIAGTGAC
jgi:ABC-type cobalamin transport system permease subunit